MSAKPPDELKLYWHPGVAAFAVEPSTHGVETHIYERRDLVEARERSMREARDALRIVASCSVCGEGTANDVCFERDRLHAELERKSEECVEWSRGMVQLRAELDEAIPTIKLLMASASRGDPRSLSDAVAVATEWLRARGAKGA